MKTSGLIVGRLGFLKWQKKKQFDLVVKIYCCAICCNAIFINFDLIKFAVEKLMAAANLNRMVD